MVHPLEARDRPHGHDVDVALHLILCKPIHVLLGQSQALQQPQLCCPYVHLLPQDPGNLQEYPLLSCT